MDRVPVPVGERCLYCDEEFTAADNGVMMPCASADWTWTIRGAHKECNLRSVMGPLAHLEKRCSCYGGTDHASPDLTEFEEAKEVYRRVTSGEAW